MFDDFREWLSDNLRYILLGLAVILVAIIIFCIVRLVTAGSRKKTNNNETTASAQTTGQEESLTEAGQTTDQTTGSAPAASADLVRNDSAVLTLVQSYYDAVADKDVGTLSKLVTPWNDTVQQGILSNDLIENYNNITTYSKQGLDEGSYVVYVYFEGKVAGYETLVPSLSRLYVVTGDGGALVINYSPDAEAEDYMNTVSADQDVQALRDDVNRQYEEALASDPDLKQFIATQVTGTASDVEEDEEKETEAAESVTTGEMKAIAGLNIRETPSTDANILGSVASGTNVTVLEDAGDGWVKIHYTAYGSDVTGYVRLEYLTETEAA